MPSRFKKRILTHLSHASYEPTEITLLAEELGVEPGDFKAFEIAVREMQGQGQLVYGDSRFVTLPPMGREVIGEFRRNPRGFGFIVPRQRTAHGDLFVPAGQTLDALTGDLVRADVHEKRRRPGDDRSPYVGEIVEIIERKQSSFTGEVRRQGETWLIYPDGKTLLDPVVVQDVGSKNAREGDKVVFEIMEYPEGDYLATGVITQVLGESGKPDVETQAVIEAYSLPGPFPQACIDEARDLTRAFDEEISAADAGSGFDRAVRADLRETFILTIDPPDAKDYDDAISIERTENGGFRLGVHIADVSHFVTPGTALDDEGKERANSVYLPRLVIPMLPEVLSNGICSLMEGVPRFCKTAFIEYDRDGNVAGQGFASTVIHSSKRLTYLEAQALIEGDQKRAELHARTKPNYTPELLDALKMMNDLAKRIEKRRFKAGMIHLDLPDVELVFDEEGRVVDAVPEDDAYTHKLIEMFMVEANEAVARHFEELGVPILRRTHPEPVPGNMDELASFVKVAGYRIPKSPTREELQGLLEATAGTPAAPAVHMAVLRTLTRAEYSPALIGHFALASAAYAHFTSPIRRYPDLTAHRALTRYLEMTKNGLERPTSDGEKRRIGKEMREDPWCPPEEELVKIGNHCNANESNAEDAERELRQFLVLQLLEEHIGGTFDGLVTGVTGRGVFVQLSQYLAEGLCGVSDLPMPNMQDGRKRGHQRGGSWSIDRRTGALVERNTGRSFNIGDRVKVTILEIDLSRRQMELAITDGESRDAGKAKRLADRLNLGDDMAGGLGRTGAQKRSQRSKSRDKRKSDYRKDRKGKGKRQ